MNKGYKIFFGFVALLLLIGGNARAFRSLSSPVKNDTTKVAKEAEAPESSIVDEVIWVVGDEPILKSDVEALRLQSEAENVKWAGDPDCSIPENIAVQKLYLHQAAIDSIEVSESDVTSRIDQQINYWISMAGSKEKLEEWRNQSISQMRLQMHDDFKNQLVIEKMRQELVKDIAVTPGDVRKYFESVPADSVPFVPTEVEVEIITHQPKVSQEEINRVKDQLRSYTNRVMTGETSFAALARLYSEDGSARQGGEMDYVGRGMLDPNFANVAFNLTDPKKISKIVETEFGYHIIQLIDKRGDKIKVRHILLKPHITDAALKETKNRMDSIADEIKAGKYTFENAATYVSDDKETKNNHGLMAYFDQETQTRTSKFEMKNLPTEIARQVEKMKVGDVSSAFQMINDKGKTVLAVIKLKSRTEGHKANMTEDFQVMKNVVLSKERDKVLHNWVVDKIKHTYVWMNPRYKNCNYEYQGWVK
ncbi:MAG: peptidylprolyl isomerase [Prevotella sp.]|jgi:peptidyl-prolyl cis-trans isomerase SurA|nr:peptidylprolyl isomerase [Prevotella sp.]MCI1282376.1 peptidylprolyl isomerase [Prevotella sp.]